MKFQRSPFGNDAQASSPSKTERAVVSPSNLPSRPGTMVRHPATAEGPGGARSQQGGATGHSMPTRRPTRVARATGPAATGRSTAPAAVVDKTTAVGLSTAVPSTNAESLPTAATAVKSEKPGENDGKNGQVLIAQQSPVLSVKTLGPRRISVGKESAYRILIENSGRVVAEDVVVTIDLPDWADVLGAEVSTGATRSDRSETGTKQFRWKVGSLNAKSRERIVLRIIPRQSRPIDLAVRWNYNPATSQTVIEVQEAKLSMRLDGPREVFFGKKETFRLEISNTGNGDADDVVITLMPIVPGEGLPNSHKLGTLQAGKKKLVEIELTARQKGHLAVQVDLRSDGEVRARLDEKILVRRAGLAIDVEGPKVQYVGTVAIYRICVSNPGNAAAGNLRVTAKIPAEAKYLFSDQGGQFAADRGKAVWVLDDLQPGAKKTLELKCRLVKAGFSRLEVQSTADADLSASAATATEVEAMADLSLEVADPAGPVPVGQETTYEVRIRNRGTKRAEAVEVVAYFSRGIEPVSVEGSPYTIGPGQVVFDSIGSLPAGKDIVLKIKARAEASGNHMFRAEVYCKTLGTKLVSEETTHYYEGDIMSSGSPQVERDHREVPTPGSSPLRTADRRPPYAPPPEKNQPPRTTPAGQPTLADPPRR